MSHKTLKMRKIYCIDAKENSTFDELREMIGWVEPEKMEKLGMLH